jgi:hypothetical protein
LLRKNLGLLADASAKAKQNIFAPAFIQEIHINAESRPPVLALELAMARFAAGLLKPEEVDGLLHGVRYPSSDTVRKTLFRLDDYEFDFFTEYLSRHKPRARAMTAPPVVKHPDKDRPTDFMESSIAPLGDLVRNRTVFFSRSPFRWTVHSDPVPELSSSRQHAARLAT